MTTPIPNPEPEPHHDETGAPAAAPRPAGGPPRTTRRKRWLIIGLIGLAILIVLGVVLSGWIVQRAFAPTASTVKPGQQATDDTPKEKVRTVAQDLGIPWEVVTLPSGDLLVTERGGLLKRIGSAGATHKVEGVEHFGEGGLLGMALHPKFNQNHYLYIYLTTRTGDVLTNRVDRYRYNNDQLTDKKTILANIPGAANHDGGRIAFGPDGRLYITTGDAGRESNSQDRNSLAGKILRLTDEGKVPGDNPFGTPIYSWGHRNPQGLAWDDKGRLWATEHGRSGLGISGYDELNLIEKGANYGWPVIEGDQTRADMKRPVIHSGPNETWAPAGLAYVDGSLFFGGLRGESLYQAQLKDKTVSSLTAHYRGDFGRLRSVSVGAHNVLYVTTSNTDGRGTPFPNDDKLFAFDVRQFIK